MRNLVIIALSSMSAVACTDDPQYVPCAPNGAAPTDECSIEVDGADNGTATDANTARLHVPVKPDALWRARDRDRRAELQMLVDPAVMVPIYRPEHYDLSVEWSVTNLGAMPGQFRVHLNGANEEIAYDPSLIMVADEDDPPAPPLAGNNPNDIGANATVEGVFREDQLLEAAIDLDQITRGNVNPFAATLTVSKNADSFQPMTPAAYDANGDPIMQTPTGPAIPRDAFRQMIRVDLRFEPSQLMRFEFTLRVREHTEVIHEMGLNAPAGELDLRDPAPYAGTL